VTSEGSKTTAWDDPNRDIIQDLADAAGAPVRFGDVARTPLVSCFCGLCGEIVHAAKYVEHAGSRWHLRCWEAYIDVPEPNPHGGDGGR
jgi:hypothetical protein